MLCGKGTGPAPIEFDGFRPDPVKAQLFKFGLRPGDDALVAHRAHTPWPDLGSHGFDNIDREIILQSVLAKGNGFGGDISRDNRRID